MDLATLFSLSVIAALVGIFLSLLANERRTQIESVTQERTLWRSTIRRLADELVKATQDGDEQLIKRSCAQLALNVNPFDSEDTALLDLAQQLAGNGNKEAQINEFTERISLLLKHDWERAKRDARHWLFRGTRPRRIPYCDSRGVGVPTRHATGSKSQLRAMFPSFALLIFSASVLFFLAVGFSEPFQNLVRVFNDSTIDKPFSAWAQFFLWSTFGGLVWSCVYILFKASEKKLLEHWFAK